MRGRLQEYATSHAIPSYFGAMNLTLRSGFCHLQGAQWSFTDERPWCRDEPRTDWISMVRDPWERMKSAFYYCEAQWRRWKLCPGCVSAAIDVLCNVGILPSGTPAVRACEFGRRWGLNYQLEHYTRLDYTSILQLPCAPPDQECPALHLSPIQLRPFNAGMRDHACLRRAIRACQLDSNQTEASRALIADAFRAQASLLAVGLVEEWDASLEMFERATRCEGLASRTFRKDVHESSLKRSDSSAFQAAEQAFDTCRVDLTRNYMKVDYALYAHAKTLFQQQQRSIHRWRGSPLREPLRCTQRRASDPIICT
jgi:hypothetical protein